MKLKVFNEIGQETGETVELNPRIFSVARIRPEVVHFVTTAVLANKRKILAVARTRGEVRGGGKKPWRQKGTGRARAGSIRSPLWRGGGVIFGPTRDRNFSKKVNRKVRRFALFQVLTDRAKENKIILLENLSITHGKTKELIAKLKNLGAVLKGKKVLLVVSTRQEKLARALSNLRNVKLCQASNLNLLEILWADSLIILKEALPVIEKTYLSTRSEVVQKLL